MNPFTDTQTKTSLINGRPTGISAKLRAVGVHQMKVGESLSTGLNPIDFANKGSIRVNAQKVAKLAGYSILTTPDVSGVIWCFRPE